MRFVGPHPYELIYLVAERLNNCRASGCSAMREWLEAARDGKNRLMSDDRGQSGAREATNVVVGLLVASLMSAYLLPMAINEIVAVDTSSWSTGAGELWALLPVIIVLGIFIFFVGLALNTGERM